MRRRGALVLGIGGLLLATGGPAAAAIYRWVDENGVVNYSDDWWRFESYRRRMNPTSAGPAPDPGLETADTSSTSESSGAGRARRMESVTDEVMRLSGLDAQIEILAGMVQAEIEQLRRRSGQVEAARDTLARTFGPELLRRNMHHSLAGQLDKERAGLVLAWLRTPLSQRIVGLENASSSASNQAEQVAFINRLPSTPPAPARLGLVHRVDRAGEVTETSAVLIGAVSVALRDTMAPFVVPRPIARVNGQPEARPAIDETFRFRIVSSLLFAYRDLSDTELGRYAVFLESPDGRWFTRAVRTALIDSLRTSPDKLVTARPPRQR
jgi:hypothetical protein